MSLLARALDRARRAADVVRVPLANHRLARAYLDDPARADREFERCLERAIGWFRAVVDFEISALFALNHLHASGIEPRVAFVQDGNARYLATHHSFRNRLLDAGHVYDPCIDPMGVSPATMQGEEAYAIPLDQIMRRCLYADRLGLGEDFLQELTSLHDGGGYGTTHIIVGGLLLKRFSRIERATIDATMARYAHCIARAQRRARAGDILAERVVTLQWIGRHDLVRPAWLLRLAAAQNDDGGWSWHAGWRDGPSNQHTTSLGVAALAQYLHARRQGRGRARPEDAGYAVQDGGPR